MSRDTQKPSRAAVEAADEIAQFIGEPELFRCRGAVARKIDRAYGEQVRALVRVASRAKAELGHEYSCRAYDYGEDIEPCSCGGVRADLRAALAPFTVPQRRAER